MIPLLLALLSVPAFADSLDCELEREGKSMAVTSPLLEGSANTVVREANELDLGLDASLAPGSFLLVLQDNAKQVRSAFTGSTEAVGFAGSSLIGQDARVACRSSLGNPPNTMPSRPSLPDYLVCVLDEVTFVNGAIAESKRVLKRAVSTPLFKFPQAILGEAGSSAFSVRLHRMDFNKGLDVTLTDRGTGAFARFTGPAATLRTSFMLGLTQGDRATRAKFQRLGCVFSNDPKALD